jgi:hypothetical protein
MARLIQGNDDEWVLRDEWGIEDIRNCIETEDIEDASGFTDEDCLNVMRVAETAFDANYGLNWDAIHFAIILYVNCKRNDTPMFYRGVPITIKQMGEAA